MALLAATAAAADAVELQEGSINQNGPHPKAAALFVCGREAVGRSRPQVRLYLYRSLSLAWPAGNSQSQADEAIRW